MKNKIQKKCNSTIKRVKNHNHPNFGEKTFHIQPRERSGSCFWRSKLHCPSICRTAQARLAGHSALVCRRTACAHRQRTVSARVARHHKSSGHTVVHVGRASGFRQRFKRRHPSHPLGMERRNAPIPHAPASLP